MVSLLFAARHLLASQLPHEVDQESYQIGKLQKIKFSMFHSVLPFYQIRVTSRVFEKITQNVAQPIFFQNKL
jgi:hypothetical protein